MLRTNLTITANVLEGYTLFSKVVKPKKFRLNLSGKSVVVVGSVSADGSVVVEGYSKVKVSGVAISFTNARTTTGYIVGEEPSKVRIGV